jgi:hypothetical protein
MPNDLKNKTGESTFSRGSTYDQVALNGDKGRFVMLKKDAERDSSGKLPKIDLGVGVEMSYDSKTGKPTVTGTTPLKLVFFKIRRALSSYNPVVGGARTNEHNNKNERVVLYGPQKGQKEYGIATSLREKYTDLHTQQIVYCYDTEYDKVVKLTVKGSSLGSEKTAKGVTKFYDYLQSFKGEDSMTKYVTEMYPVAEEGPKGVYFALDFVRGRELDAEEAARVSGLLDSVHAEIEASDASFKERMKAAMEKGEVVEDETTQSDAPAEITYPEENINPEDIPF